MNKYYWIAFLLVLCLSNSLLSQNNTAKEYFSSPLKLPFSFSGNFGELRPSHFHSGLDFRTQGRIGIPVYAAKEGYISRVSVSPTGYGNALYITHPDGLTTVYGHLSRFNSRIQAFVRDRQYYTENYQINVTLTPQEFNVTKGELIAWSGNTGNSGGPHLHFEIRNTKSERAMNPVFYLRGIKDNSAPSILSLYAYPLSAQSHINKSSSKKRFSLIKAAGGYSLTNNAIEAFGRIGFGIQANDDFNGTGIKCGIYGATLFCDGKAVFEFKMDDFSFDKTRYSNSQMDYEESFVNKRKIYRLYRQPGNELDIYNPLINDGILELEDGKTHNIQIVVSDAFHNKSILKFKVLSHKYALPETKFPSATMFSYDKENKFKNEEVKIVIPKGALYEDFRFFYGNSPKRKGYYSNIQEIHDPTVPLQKPFQISIKAEDLPEELEEKSLIVRIDNFGNRSSAGGDFSGGWVTTQTSEFGNYAVSFDTVSPVIVPINIRDRKFLINKNEVQFRIGDNLSGVKTFRGEIDDKWVLFEYNPKTGIISYIFDKDRFEFGREHHLKLVVTDNKQNQSEYDATFYR
jgi:hypothetical protein